ncbi:hypothetical protein ANO11243_049670 [Dothideomycetidae sp. 11243]|nr:hypothetical protein ANO11243_049670 [fungal sp. No.11243]
MPVTQHYEGQSRLESLGRLSTKHDRHQRHDSLLSYRANSRTTSRSSSTESTHRCTVRTYDNRFSERVAAFRDREYPQLNGTNLAQLIIVIVLAHMSQAEFISTPGARWSVCIEESLYAKSLVRVYAADLIGNLYGNPHSENTPAAAAGQRVEQVREKALRFFNADPKEWDLIFTANATASIKLVGECMHDYATSNNTPLWYGFHRDAHTSLVGVREMASNHRCFTSDAQVEDWINGRGIGGAEPGQLGLFAFPGQSNMTGRRLPLAWCGRIRRNVYKAPVYTLLDAAALASTAELDLSDPTTTPDFVALSFYKIFGMPDIGALIVHKAAKHVLMKRRFFGGGTVDVVVAVDGSWHTGKETLHDRLEAGTLPFHEIIALGHAIDVHDRLYGPDPMKFISNHTSRLGKLVFDGLSTLRHSNGEPMVEIYNESGTVYGDSSRQGATIAFSVRDVSGQLVTHKDVEVAANREGIFVRSGSLCNPGGMATYLKWQGDDLRRAHAAGYRCGNVEMQTVYGKATGVVRVSIGPMNTAADIHAFIDFIERHYFDHQPIRQPSPPMLLKDNDREAHSIRAVTHPTKDTRPISSRRPIGATKPIDDRQRWAGDWEMALAIRTHLQAAAQKP